MQAEYNQLHVAPNSLDKYTDDQLLPYAGGSTRAIARLQGAVQDGERGISDSATVESLGGTSSIGIRGLPAKAA